MRARTGVAPRRCRHTAACSRAADAPLAGAERPAGGRRLRGSVEAKAAEAGAPATLLPRATADSAAAWLSMSTVRRRAAEPRAESTSLHIGRRPFTSRAEARARTARRCAALLRPPR